MIFLISKKFSLCLALLFLANILCCNSSPENNTAKFATSVDAPLSLPTPWDGFECSDKWKITGYFTPVETEYPASPTEKIKITQEFSSSNGKYVDINISEKFSKEFLKLIYDKESCDKYINGNTDFDCGEGFGKTKFGWYLGGFVEKKKWIWIKSDAPLGDRDNVLDLNTIAVTIDENSNKIPRDSLVKIPDLPLPYNTKIFSVKDVGLSVGEKQIDIYCGEGKSAEQETFKITRLESNELVKVCYKKSN
ncbi:MAG TPA: hypothetical protein VF721_03010 [Pyrinomonadaceae bacterium]|jgi:hypothetical protein